MNFLSTIPRSSEVINITAGFSVDEEKGLKDFDEVFFRHIFEKIPVINY